MFALEMPALLSTEETGTDVQWGRGKWERGNGLIFSMGVFPMAFFHTHGWEVEDWLRRVAGPLYGRVFNLRRLILDSVKPKPWSQQGDVWERQDKQPWHGPLLAHLGKFAVILSNQSDCPDGCWTMLTMVLKLHSRNLLWKTSAETSVIWCSCVLYCFAAASEKDLLFVSSHGQFVRRGNLTGGCVHFVCLSKRNPLVISCGYCHVTWFANCAM